MTHKRFYSVVIVCALVLSSVPNGFARSTSQDRENLEAAFIYQFTRYVEWPPETFQETNDRFEIVVVGDRKLYDALVKVVSGKNVDDRPFETRFTVEPRELPFGHIVYFGEEVVERSEVDPAWPSNAALTVSAAERFTREGGVVRIYEKDSRLRIEINIDAAERSQLKISSKLLGLANVVRDESD